MNRIIHIQKGLLAFAVVPMLAFTGCAKKQTGIPEQPGKVDSIPGNKTTVIIPDKEKMLRNPLNGWVLYGSGTPASDYWTKMDNIKVPGLANTVKIEEYAGTFYVRTSWTLLNPSEGVYGWDTNEAFKTMLAGARQRKMKLAFRVVIDSRDKAEDFTPAYVKNAGVQGYTTQTGSKTVWSPYPDDPIFQQKYSAFVKAFASKFNDPEQVEFIDGFGLGKWGEAHSMNYINVKNREQVFKWVVDLYTKEFTKIPLAINYHRLIAMPSDWGAADPLSETLLNYAFDKGYVLRQDAFGMSGYYQSWEKGIAAKWRYKLPNIMEGGWVTGQHPFNTDAKGYITKGDVRRGEYADSKEAGVNMMDFRIGETEIWFNETYNLVKSFISEGGYRLYPDQVSLPVYADKTGTVTIGSRWNNMGWGYCPNNLKQWNYKYKVAFALLDPTTRQVKSVFVDNNTDPSKWIKGSPVSYKFTPSLNQVTAGKYIWAVAIVDTTKDNKPGILMATQGETTSEGWLVLSQITVK